MAHFSIKSWVAVFSLSTVIFLGGCSQSEDYEVSVTRLLDRPLIGPDIHPSIGINIHGRP